MTKKIYQLMNWREIEAIVYSESNHPGLLLGIHKEGTQSLIQAYFPDSMAVTVCFEKNKDEKKKTKSEYPMELVDEAGYYAVLVPKSIGLEYTYRVEYKDRTVEKKEDCYSFCESIQSKELELFQKGIHYEIYRCLGAHSMRIGGVDGVRFALWAPNAIRVSVIGDFNNWDARANMMNLHDKYGVFELFVPGVTEGMKYQFEVLMKGNTICRKADPYSFRQDITSSNVSIIQSLDTFEWDDDNWLSNRRFLNKQKEAISVYEIDLGRFKRSLDGGDLNYRLLAAEIIPYIKEMGYTHIQMMPIMEYSSVEARENGSSAYYAPTSRFGEVEDLKYFINECHKAEIAVILEWNPAYFPKEEYGLGRFDGTCLYEHLDPRKGCHPSKDAYLFHYSRPQVSNFLLANALFWIKEFHADGIRVESVSNMLYLDYGRKQGEWIPNEFGGPENLESVEFLKHFNSIISKKFPGVLKIAEDDSIWPRVTASLNIDGLGFDLKWNAGFGADYMEYIHYDPYFRSCHHGELTYSMVYAYNEKYMIGFSHEEVTNAEGSLLSIMPGNEEDKKKNLRATFAYTMMHPGKKLFFMGQDLGEDKKWNEKNEVQWGLLEAEANKGINALVKELNTIYRSYPALYTYDETPEGFEWINNISANESIISFLRKTDLEDEFLLVVANFANCVREKYRIGVPYPGKYKEILNTDSEKFKGDNFVNTRAIASKEEECDGKSQSISMKIAPLSVSVFTFRPFTQKEQDAIEEKKRVAAQKEAERIAQLKEIEKERKHIIEEKKRLLEEADRKLRELDEKASKIMKKEE